MTAPPPLVPATAGRTPAGEIRRIVLVAAVLFAVLEGGLALLVPRLDQTWAGLIATSAMLVVLAIVERGVYGRDLRSAARALGYGRPATGAVLAAIAISVLMLSFFPLYSLLSGTPLALRADWWWILVGAVVLNGIGEETLFRGFVFGGLRRAGHSFRSAGLVSLAVFAAIHLFLFIGNPPVIAFLATVLAVASAFPFACLYERAGGVIWAGVILHVAAHAVRLVDIPEAQFVTVVSAWSLLEVGGMLLVFAFTRRPRADRPRAALVAAA